MNTAFTTAHFVAQRDEELVADATAYHQNRSRRAERGSHSPSRREAARRVVAQIRARFRTWYADGEL